MWIFFFLIIIVLLNSYGKMVLLFAGYEAIAYREEKRYVSCFLRICGEYVLPPPLVLRAISLYRKCLLLKLNVAGRGWIIHSTSVLNDDRHDSCQLRAE